MCFELNDKAPVITRDNYEEYFLMYVDDELTPQERSLVEAFLQFHPELQAELDALMGAKLEPEVLRFDGMESLLAESMETNLVDEALLLHVDGELPESEKEKLEQRLQHDEAYRTQHQWLLRTKSDAAEVVPCPNKEDLYRHTVRRIHFAPALRVAAAVLLVASLGLLWWMQGGNETAAPAVATVNTKVSQPGSTAAAPPANVAAQPEKDAAAPEQKSADEMAETKAAPQLAQVPQPKKSSPAIKKIEAQPAVKAITPEAAPEDQLAAAEPEPMPRRNNDALVAQAFAAPEKDFAPDVTNRTPDAYNTTAARFASSTEDDRGGGKANLKSLLRRATRVVERRANIDATNDEDELIIGAVAIKLK